MATDRSQWILIQIGTPPTFVEFPEDFKGKSMVNIDPAAKPFCEYEYRILLENAWWTRRGNCIADVVSEEYTKRPNPKRAH